MRDRHINGRAIRTLREKRGIHQSELARQAGISRSYLKEIEGLVSKPDAPTRQPTAVVAYRIANALGVDLNAFSTVLETDAAA